MKHRLRVVLATTSGDGIAASDEPTFGEVVASPEELARRLCLVLGDPLPAAPQGTRERAYADAIAAHDDGNRTYSHARSHDPLGVTRHLLRLRDELREAGWDGRALLGSERLAELATLERHATGLPPGPADAVHRALACLPGSLPMPLTLEHVAPLPHYAACVNLLVERLRTAGAAVVALPAPAPPPGSDLARILTERGPLSGDGSLVVLEGETREETAELVEAWTRRHPAARRVITSPGHAVVPVDEVLWWGFVAGSGTERAFDPWTRAERSAARAAGVAWPPPGHHRAVEAWSWRHAARCARRRLVLAGWRSDAKGAPAVHPFAEEIAARTGGLGPARRGTSAEVGS